MFTFDFLRRLLKSLHRREYEVRDLRTGQIVSRDFIRAYCLDDARDIAKVVFSNIPDEFRSVEDAHLDRYGH